MVVESSRGSGSFLFQRAINSRLYASALAAAYRNGVEVYDPDYALTQDPEFWEKVQRDPVIKYAMEQRLHAVAGRDWITHPGTRTPTSKDQKAAAVAEQLLEHIENFTEARYHAGKFAFLGETFAYTESKRVPLEIEGKRQMWWVPTRIKNIDKRRLRAKPDFDPRRAPGDEVRMIYQLHDIGSFTWKNLAPNAPLWHAEYDSEESRMSHGRGLAEAIYFHHYAKTVVFQYGLEGLEKWAQGMIVAKVDGTARTALDNEETRANYLKELDNQRAGGTFVMDINDELDVHWANGQGSKQVFDWLQYLDHGITQVILGASAGALPGAVETNIAAMQSEQQRSDTLLGYDREVLYESMTKHLIGHIWHNNQRQLREIGLDKARKPQIRAAKIDDTNPGESIEVITKALAAGIPLVESEVYDRIGMTPPGPEDETIEGRLLPGEPVPGQDPLNPGKAPVSKPEPRKVEGPGGQGSRGD